MARVGLLLAALVVALGFGELAFRIINARKNAPSGDDDAWRARYRRMNDTLYRRSANAELIYEPVAGSSVAMEYGHAAFNAGSMRDDIEYSHERGVLPRVAMVGDSIVWSEFVALEKSLPRQVDSELNGQAELLNFGVTGYDTSQEAAWYETHVRQYHPDVVVVVYCMNDTMIMSGPFEHYATQAERARKDEQDSFFARAGPIRRETVDGMIKAREESATFRLLARAMGIWDRARFDAHYTDEYLLMAQVPARRAQLQQALDRLGRAIRADGAKPLLVISPVLESWRNYRWMSIHERVRDLATRAGFEVIDPLDYFRAHHNETAVRISGDNLHYNEEGNRVFGRAIATRVRELIAR